MLLRGAWALVEEGVNTVTVAQCQIPPAPPGTVITVTGDAIQYFETVATVGTVTQRDASSIEAEFTQPSGDTVLTSTIRMDGQDDGQVLITRDPDDSATPGPQRYLRCPTRATNT